MQFTFSELWGHMGLFARLVVGVMGAMSLSSLFVVAERILVLYRSARDSRVYAEAMITNLSKGALEPTNADRNDPNLGHLGRVIESGLHAFRDTVTGGDVDLTFESVTRALERQASREVHTMKRGGGILASVSSTAPFVGLLGTVLGIVNSFQQMASAGSGGLGTVSAGISEALVTTALGLLVAIPAVIAYNSLQTWVDSRSVDISEASNELLDVVARKLRYPLAGNTSLRPAPRAQSR